MRQRNWADPGEAGARGRARARPDAAPDGRGRKRIRAAERRRCRRAWHVLDAVDGAQNGRRRAARHQEDSRRGGPWAAAAAWRRARLPPALRAGADGPACRAAVDKWAGRAPACVLAVAAAAVAPAVPIRSALTTLAVALASRRDGSPDRERRDGERPCVLARRYEADAAAAPHMAGAARLAAPAALPATSARAVVPPLAPVKAVPAGMPDVPPLRVEPLPPWAAAQPVVRKARRMPLALGQEAASRADELEDAARCAYLPPLAAVSAVRARQSAWHAALRPARPSPASRLLPPDSLSHRTARARPAVPSPRSLHHRHHPAPLFRRLRRQNAGARVRPAHLQWNSSAIVCRGPRWSASSQ